MSTRTIQEELPWGARWRLDVPDQWNGVLALFSEGYGGDGPQRAPDVAGDPVTKELLLARGYALAGSSSPHGGWAVEEALNDQRATIEAASGRLGRPDHVIAWGRSMGGLITAGLAQEHPDVVNGAVAFCASVAGPIPMLNQGLDAAFAFGALFGAQDGLEAAGATEAGFARMERGRLAVAQARQDEAGRARVALVASLAQLPTWTYANLMGPRTEPAEPDPDDLATQQDQQASVLHLAAFSPRQELEQRAGGIFSWNTGIDYARQLELSGFADFVARGYDRAGIDLESDLARINSAERITALPEAVAYMERNLTPHGRIDIPVLTVSVTGDFAPTVTQTSAYAAVVEEAGSTANLRQVYSHAPGHCSFSTVEIVAAIDAMRATLDAGSWVDTTPDVLTRAATEIAESRWPRLKPARFVEFTPAPHVRPYPRSARVLTPAPTPDVAATPDFAATPHVAATTEPAVASKPESVR